MIVRVAIAQINPTVGDLAGNVRLIVKACEGAVAQGADVLVTPELALTGYPPEDLLLRPAFHAAAAQALSTLMEALAKWPELHVVVGHPERVALDTGPAVYNSASVLVGGALHAVYRKQALPNYQVFDELRYFSAGASACVFDVKGVRFGVAICEDIWFPEVAAQAQAAGAQALLVPNGSPYHIGKGQHRIEIARERVAETGLAIVYANLVGGQDELQFDGDSFVVDATGAEQLRLPHCESALGVVDLEWIGHGPRGRLQVQRSTLSPVLEHEEAVYRVLVQGVRDYIGKNGFPGAIIGLSGGVDSALTLAIAVDAIGADRVRAVMMPSPYTADISWLDSREMVARLGVQYEEISITPVFDAFQGQLAQAFAGLPEDTTEENIQARIRGTLLMALSNKTGRIVLTTGNKSEMATGYCTLYGDMAGGYAVIKDEADGFWKYAKPATDRVAFVAVPQARVGSTDPSQLGLEKHAMPDKKRLQDFIEKQNVQVAAQLKEITS